MQRHLPTVKSVEIADQVLQALVERPGVEQVPVKAPIVVPLPTLTELSANEE